MRLKDGLIETESVVSFPASKNERISSESHIEHNTFYYYYLRKTHDPSTGLYYYGSRYYDPGINRFISEDTTKGTLTDPISLNRYAYAGNNPEAIVDPDGHGWGSWLTNAVSSAANVITSGASAVVTGLSSVATTVSNDWNSLPPTDQALIVAGAVTAGVVAATVLSGGAAAPLAADAIAAEAGDVAATEAAADAASTASTVGWNAAGGALGGSISNGLQGVAEGKSITSVGFWENVGEGAAIGAAGGALTGGLGQLLPKTQFASWLFGQALGGVDTELGNVAFNGHVNHVRAPAVWESIAFGALNGVGGGLLGEEFGGRGGNFARGTLVGGLSRES